MKPLVNKDQLLLKLMFIVLLICCCVQGFAQTNNKNTLNNTEDVENWIFKNYHPDNIKLKQICQSSCVFMRFKILKGGKIGSLAFNKNVPEFIADALTKAIKSIEGNAMISADIQSNEKVYLLPFIYDYQAGCKNTYEQKDYTIVQKDMTGNIVYSQQHGEAIFNMLNFTDKKMMSLNCIILPPISTGNVIMN